MNVLEHDTPAVLTPEAFAATEPEYAGQTRRLGAYLVDGLLFTPIYFGLSVLVVALSLLLPERYITTTLLFSGMLVAGLFTVIYWLYSALLESSPWQATIGKKLFGIKVTDRCGQRLSFARANLRMLGKVITYLTFGLGLVTYLLSEQNRTLHDFIAGTLVLRHYKAVAVDEPAAPTIPPNYKTTALS